MRYEICLAKGYPIGSGVIEGVCRNLINDRLELTGMIWTIQEAESVMRLPAVHINKDWDAFRTYRRRSEGRRLYGIEDSSCSDIQDKELSCAAQLMTGSSGTQKRVVILSMNRNGSPGLKRF